MLPGCSKSSTWNIWTFQVLRATKPAWHRQTRQTKAIPASLSRVSHVGRALGYDYLMSIDSVHASALLAATVLSFLWLVVRLSTCVQRLFYVFIVTAPLKCSSHTKAPGLFSLLNCEAVCLPGFHKAAQEQVGPASDTLFLLWYWGFGITHQRYPQET